MMAENGNAYAFNPDRPIKDMIKDFRRWAKEDKNFGALLVALAPLFESQAELGKAKAKNSRQMLAFFLFSQDKRDEVQQSHPEWQLNEVGEELVRQWEHMPEETKHTYEQMGVGDKVGSEHQAQDKLSGDQKEGCSANGCAEMDEIQPATEVHTSAENKKTD